MPDKLELKKENDKYLTEGSILQSSVNPDKKAFKTIEELELRETNLKYSLRKWIAGFLTGCAGIVLVVFVWHLIAPPCCRWLPQSDVDSIRSVALTLFGALALSIATLFYARK